MCIRDRCDDIDRCNKTLDFKISGDWKEYRISLSSFEKLGTDMSKITSALIIKAKKGVDIGLSNVRLE